MLEVIAESLSDALAAEAGGADRIELVSALTEGGLTPSIGLIEEVLNAVSIPVHVMVRPHSRSFSCGRDDLRIMRADIRAIRKLNAHGIVTGVLTGEREIDTGALHGLLEEAGGMSVTFHRAFDQTADLCESLRAISAFPQIRRLLTSGGQPCALQAVDTIKRLKESGDGSGLTVLAGGGLTIDTLGSFVQAAGVIEVHMGTGVRAAAVRGGPPVVDAASVARAKAALQAALRKGTAAAGD